MVWSTLGIDMIMKSKIPEMIFILKNMVLIRWNRLWD